MTEFITRNYGQKEFEVIIKTDSKDHYKQAEEFSRKLIDHAKPMTNAQKIRSMNDEELAEFIYRCEMSEIDYAKTFCDLCNGQYECGQCRLEWLQQPQKGE